MNKVKDKRWGNVTSIWDTNSSPKNLSSVAWLIVGYFMLIGRRSMKRPRLLLSVSCISLLVYVSVRFLSPTYGPSSLTLSLDKWPALPKSGDTSSTLLVSPIFVNPNSHTAEFNKYWIDLYFSSFAPQLSRVSALESAPGSKSAILETKYGTSWRCNSPDTPQFCLFENVYIKDGTLVVLVDKETDENSVAKLQNYLSAEFQISAVFTRSEIGNAEEINGWSITWTDDTTSLKQELLILSAFMYTISQMQTLRNVEQNPEIAAVFDFSRSGQSAFIQQLLCADSNHQSFYSQCSNKKWIRSSQQVYKAQNLIIGHHSQFSVREQLSFFHRTEQRELTVPLVETSDHATIAKRLAQQIASKLVTQDSVLPEEPKLCYISDPQVVENDNSIVNKLPSAEVFIASDFKTDLWLSFLKSLQKCTSVIGPSSAADILMFLVLAKLPSADLSIIELQPYSHKYESDQTLKTLALWARASYLNLRASSISSARFIVRKPALARLNANANAIFELFPTKYKDPLALLTKVQKNFREQFKVNVVLLEQLLALDTAKYLLFMPWEQLNNQLIELKSACAVAHELDRVLVLPLIGQRKPESTAWDFTFKIDEFNWEPFSRYFDENAATFGFPCKAITMSNFQSYNTRRTKQLGSQSSERQSCRDVGLETLHFNPFGTATISQQLTDYYANLLGLCVNKDVAAVSNDGRQYQLSSQQVRELYGQNKETVLALGSMFWYYGFDRNQPYPLVSFVDYMDHELYKRTTVSFKFVPLIQFVVELAIETSIRPLLNAASVAEPADGKRFVFAIHVRRGDYWNKCSKIKSEQLRKHCYPSVQQIAGKLARAHQAEKARLHRSGSAVESSLKPLLYISTNLGHDSKEFDPLAEKYELLFFKDIFQSLFDKPKTLQQKLFGRLSGENIEPIELQTFSQWLETTIFKIHLDSIENAFLDIQLASDSIVDHFIGNFYSSFSRTIIEKRELKHLKLGLF